MSPEAQRSAIGKACGWTLVPRHHFWRKDEVWWKHPTRDAHFSSVPNYLKDLNAMQSAVMSQPQEFQEQFACRLAEMRTAKHKMHHQLSPADWAEAFLRNLGKWEDSA